MIDSALTALVTEIEVRNSKWENTTQLGEADELSNVYHDRSVLIVYIDQLRAEISKLNRIIEQDDKVEHMLREALLHISRHFGSAEMCRELANYYLDRDADLRLMNQQLREN